MSGGMIQPSVSFGVASYNFGTNEWGYLGKHGNKWYEDLGYGFGALANLQDIVAGVHGTSIDVKARPEVQVTANQMALIMERILLFLLDHVKELTLKLRVI